MEVRPWELAESPRQLEGGPQGGSPGVTQGSTGEPAQWTPGVPPRRIRAAPEVAAGWAGSRSGSEYRSQGEDNRTSPREGTALAPRVRQGVARGIAVRLEPPESVRALQNAECGTDARILGTGQFIARRRAAQALIRRRCREARVGLADSTRGIAGADSLPSGAPWPSSSRHGWACPSPMRRASLGSPPRGLPGRSHEPSKHQSIESTTHSKFTLLTSP